MTRNNTQYDERKGLPSASAWRRYELCAGSWQLEREAKGLGQAAHVSSEFSEAGDRIHAYLAGLVDEDGNEIQLSESEAQTADFLQERATEQAQRIFGDQPTQQLDEKRLWLYISGRQVLSGRFDRVIYTKETALVQDFKSGWTEPDAAEQNAQLKVLSVLVALSLPNIKEVVAQIISGPYGVTEARYNLSALSIAYNEIIATLERIHDERAELVPGPGQCKYCPAINICQAVKDLVKPIATLQVSALPDGERAAKLLDEVELLQEHLDEIKAYYKGRMTLDPNYRIPGYDLVPGAAKREVLDWDAARKRLEEFIPAGELNGAANYRLGDLERALGKALELKAKAAKEKLNEILGELVIEKQNGASLKRVNGKAKLPAL